MRRARHGSAVTTLWKQVLEFHFIARMPAVGTDLLEDFDPDSQPA